MNTLPNRLVRLGRLNPGNSLVPLSFIFVLGAVLRVGNQASKEFYVDELWRVQDILFASNFWGAKQHLQLVEWLLGRWSLTLLGPNEFSLRLGPLIFAIVAVAVLGALSLEFLSWQCALVAITLFAIAPGNIEHAHEFKTYSLETLLTLLIFWATIRFIAGRDSLLKIAIALSTAALFAPNIMPFFVFLPLLLFWNGRAEGTRPKWYLSLGAPWIIFGVLAALYYPLYTKKLSQFGVFDFWQRLYLGPETWQFILGYKAGEAISWYMLPIFPRLESVPALGALASVVLFLLAPLLLLRRRDYLGWFVLGPFAVMIVLSLAGKYPLFSRVSAFWYPVPLLLALKVLDGHTTERARSAILISVVLLAAVSLIPGVRGRHENVWVHKPAIAMLEAEGTAGEVLAVNELSLLALNVYGLANRPVFHEAALPYFKDELELRMALDGLEMKHSGRTVWLLGAQNDEVALALPALAAARGWRERSRLLNPCTYLYRYEIP